MAILNITYEGQSADYTVDFDYQISDEDVRRIAVELVRSGGPGGIDVGNLRDDAFRHYVVDRLDSPQGEQRIYLRPKVPFGVG